MALKRFRIKNYRSFDDSGVVLDKLNKINVLIGKNNCGKSNCLRFIKALGENLKNLKAFPNELNDQYRRNGVSASIGIAFKGTELVLSGQNLQSFRTLNLDDFLSKDHELIYNLRNTAVTNIDDVFKSLDNRELIPFQNYYTGADTPSLLNRITIQLNQKISDKILHYFSNVIYIPHLRIIKEGHKFGDSNSEIDGSNIISKMFEMQNPGVGEELEREKFLKIQRFVRELLNNEELVIEIPHNRDNIIISMNGNRLPLDYYGTGIHQLVMLCSTLVIHENSIVCIEEPEIHLHPELQRKFFNFLLTTNNTYFITTHSNIFLEYNKDVSIYHVYYDGIKTSVNNCSTSAHAYELLASLGYKASDLMHSNGIIWVEGPSDRTLINKWISIIDNTLIEGIHYSIMYYGGRLLSTLSFSAEHNAEEITKELIPLLKINKNAYVVIDRDGFESKASINRTKKRVCNEIGEGKFWVTKGREIENYIQADVINRWLGTSTIDNDSNTPLGNSIRKVLPKFKYESNKNGYIKDMVDLIDDRSLDMHDLRNQIKNLIKAIHEWNK